MFWRFSSEQEMFESHLQVQQILLHPLVLARAVCTDPKATSYVNNTPAQTNIALFTESCHSNSIVHNFPSLYKSSTLLY